MKFNLTSICFLLFIGCTSNPTEKNEINSFTLLITRKDGVPYNLEDYSIQENLPERNYKIEVYKFNVFRSGKMVTTFGEGKMSKNNIEYLNTNSKEEVQLQMEVIDSLFKWCEILHGHGNYSTKIIYNDSWSVQLNVGSMQRNFYDGEFPNKTGMTEYQNSLIRAIVNNSPIKVKYYPN